MSTLVKLCVIGLVGVLVFASLASAANDGKRDDLESRIRAGDSSAMQLAANNNRQDLLPVLREVATVYDWKTSSIPLSMKALARLGDREHMDLILSRLTNPQQASGYEFQYRLLRVSAPSDTVAEHWAARAIQTDALAALAYVNQPATVNYMAPFLYETEILNPAPHAGMMDSMANLVIQTLHMMNVTNAPPLHILDDPRYDRIAAWQRWWEQHKDYYEKLELGASSLPPADHWPLPSERRASSPAGQVTPPAPVSPSGSIPPSPASSNSPPPANWPLKLAIIVVIVGVVGVSLAIRARNR